MVQIVPSFTARQVLICFRRRSRTVPRDLFRQARGYLAAIWAHQAEKESGGGVGGSDVMCRGTVGKLYRVVGADVLLRARSSAHPYALPHNYFSIHHAIPSRPFVASPCHLPLHVVHTARTADVPTSPLASLRISMV